MALKLNESREAYREFYGRDTEQMPKLIADGRVPMNVAQLMQRRLDVRNSDTDVKNSYLDNWFETGDAVIYHPDGRVKIVLDSQPLRDMTPDTPRRGGALIIGEDVYKTFEGEEFKKGKLGKINKWLSRGAVKSHPVWKVLARDQGLLNDYADYIFAEGKQRFDYNTAMGISLGLCNGNSPEMKAWLVEMLVNNRSDANGRLVLDNNHARLVGIAQEAPSALGKSISKIKVYTMMDLQAFDNALKGLEGTLHPDVLKPFAELRKKL